MAAKATKGFAGKKAGTLSQTEQEWMKAISSAPTSPPVAAPVEIDAEQVFQLYAVMGCDAERTAGAVNLDVAVIKAMAKAGDWDGKLEIVKRLRKSGKPGDAERATNRAINFVQAYRYRVLLERILRRLSAYRDEDLDKLFDCPIFNKEGDIVGRRITTRPFADLAVAIEKCQSMIYIALNDTVTERMERDDETGGKQASATELHVQIATQLAKMRGETASGVPLDIVEDARQLAEAEAKAPDPE